MQRTPSERLHSAEDPRSLAEQAIRRGDLEEGQAWATLATAHAGHRIAKTIGRVLEVDDSTNDVKRGRVRKLHETPGESEQAA